MSNYADLTNLANALKYVYGDWLKNQFADEKIQVIVGTTGFSFGTKVLIRIRILLFIL